MDVHWRRRGGASLLTSTGQRRCPADRDGDRLRLTIDRQTRLTARPVLAGIQRISQAATRTRCEQDFDGYEACRPCQARTVGHEPESDSHDDTP